MSEHSQLWLEQQHGDIALRIRVRELLASVQSPFQHIEVLASYAYGNMLRLGGQVVLTEHDEALYNEGMVHPAMSHHPNPQRILVLGGGDGGMARELIRYPQVTDIVVVEIDQAVVDISRKYFPASAAGLDDPRVQLVIDDAHRYLSTRQAAQETFDVIIIDSAQLYDPSSDAVQTQPLSESLHQCLNPDGRGLVICPLGSPQYQADDCRRSWLALRERWPESCLYQLTIPSMPGGSWCVAIGGLAEASADPQTAHDHGVDLSPLQYWEPALQPRLFHLPKHLRLLFA